MLLMIRINLLGRAGGKKGKRGGFSLPRIPNVGLLLALLILVIEGAAAFQWSQQASDEAARAEAKVRKAKEEVAELGRIKAELDTLKRTIAEAKKESVIFEELFAEKTGPAAAMTYLCFMLSPRREAEVPGDELKQMELAGWRISWPGERARAWLTSVKERSGEVTLTGAAVDHSDVAEVQRRLESSAHFRMTKLVSQEIKANTDLGVQYVEFTIRGTMIYLIEPVKTPEAVAAEAAAAEAAAAPEADAGGDATADPDASGDGETTGGMLKSSLVPSPDASDADDSDTMGPELPADRDSGSQPILPKPAAPPPPPPPPPTGGSQDRGSQPPMIAPAAEPPAADQGTDPNDPGTAPGATAPGETGGANP